MAELNNILPKEKITKQNLIDQMFAINKKFVMIDSRAYTDDAFEYVLKLADLSGAIVFIYDTKKIWANGQFFGGDTLQKDLHYYTELFTADEEGHVTGTTKADKAGSNLTIVGKSHVKTYAAYDKDASNSSVLAIDYDLDSAVNRDQIKIGDSYYNLIVENGQIKLHEYSPIKITCSQLPVLEYDSGNTEVAIELNITGSLAETSQIVADVQTSVDIEVKQDGSIVRATIPNNTEVEFTFTCNDGTFTSVTKVTQKWGYGVWVGKYNEDFNGGINSLFTKDIDYLISLETMKKFLWVPGTKLNVKVEINQSETEYGLVVCPRDLDIEFTDVSTQISGGWKPCVGQNATKYSTSTIYNVICTDHKGLGNITWKLKS